MNQGPDGEGFTICTNCGAAVPGNNVTELKKYRQPYTPIKGRGNYCNHDGEIVNTFLGYQFLTDMVLFEIKLDNTLKSNPKIVMINIAINASENKRNKALIPSLPASRLNSPALIYTQPFSASSLLIE